MDIDAKSAASRTLQLTNGMLVTPTPNKPTGYFLKGREHWESFLSEVYTKKKLSYTETQAKSPRLYIEMDVLLTGVISIWHQQNSKHKQTAC